MTEGNWLQNLTKSDSDKWIGGVCGGLGESSPIPSWTWRLLFVMLLICFWHRFIVMRPSPDICSI
jgi:phage shock protein C